MAGCSTSIRGPPHYVSHITPTAFAKHPPLIEQQRKLPVPDASGFWALRHTDVSRHDIWIHDHDNEWKWFSTQKWGKGRGNSLLYQGASCQHGSLGLHKQLSQKDVVVFNIRQTSCIIKSLIRVQYPSGKDSYHLALYSPTLPNLHLFVLCAG